MFLCIKAARLILRWSKLKFFLFLVSLGPLCAPQSSSITISLSSHNEKSNIHYTVNYIFRSGKLEVKSIELSGLTVFGMAKACLSTNGLRIYILEFSEDGVHAPRD